jgi:Ca-activated chloride channel family protein
MDNIFERSRSSRQAQGPAAFRDTTTGFAGWRVTLEPQRAVPTPAVARGRIFVGGGFGSHDFYAFDGHTGSQAWHLGTTDDGPTAAVVAEGLVVFNTESCTLEVVEAASGKVVWEKWLGDPLLAQPAVMDERVLMVYPKHGNHWLGAFTLKEGRPLWETRLDHDVITAPVVAEGRVYLSTFDGTVWCIEPDTGRVNWNQQMQATSAPWVYQGDVYVSHRENAPRGARQPGDPSRTRRGDAMTASTEVPRERTSRVDAQAGSLKASYSSKMASYLSSHSGAARKAAVYSMMDSAVGFSAAPGSAKLDVANELVGERLVSRTWRFQGSRAVVVNGILYDTTGDRLEASDIRTGEILWSWHEAKTMEGERRLTPPAVANGRVWAGTWDGRVISWDSLTGEVRWAVNLGAPCHWQPVVSDGWVYVGLEDGSLVGFATGDPLDTDWPMWGGGCGHNGKPLHEARPRMEARTWPTPNDPNDRRNEDVESTPAPAAG